MSRCSLLYEDWQMQCCGTPFNVGDAVSWLAAKWDVTVNDDWDSAFMALSPEKIQYYYEAHSPEHEKLFVLNGTVSKIFAIHSAIEPDSNDTKMHIRVPKIITPVTYADGRDEDIDGLRLDSYLIILEGADIRPAGPDDASFH